MPIKYFVGIDVSKASLDATLLFNGSFHSVYKLGNSVHEIKTWLRDLSIDPGIRKANVLFCLEHAGLYAEHLVNVLSKKGLNIWVEGPIQIKRSMGLQRGKNDRIDSLRIAQYAYLHRSRFRPWVKPRVEIEQLRNLSALRFRLLNALVQLKISLRETVPFLKKDRSKLIGLNCSRSIESLQADIKQTEKTILAIIKNDPALEHLYRLVVSVDYIGPVIGTQILIATNEFKNFATARKFACYCGVVPFEHSSGTSINSRPRVSKVANKRMRGLLHNAAVGSVKYPGELRDYFLRKVAEGRPKRSVLNAIRNKLIRQVFACVKENRSFQRKQLKAGAPTVEEKSTPALLNTSAGS